jgi:hypothetical protein
MMALLSNVHCERSVDGMIYVLWKHFLVSESQEHFSLKVYQFVRLILFYYCYFIVDRILLP